MRLSISPTADLALGVQIAYMATLRAGCRIDDAVDEYRLPRNQRFSKSFGERLLVGHVIPCAAVSLNQFVVACLHQNGGRRIASSAAVYVVATVNPAIVENNRDDRK